ncbi:MAG: phosphonate utilization associated transcriptional regulator [Burkholderiales bacterium]
MAAHSAIDIVQQNSLTTLVRRELERRILDGGLVPGSKLNEAELASELRVSRGPVREAFRALEQTGLVRTEKNRGVFVRQVSLEEADEIYEVRAALEALIGRLAARRILPGQLEQIRAVVRKMHALARSRDANAYYPLNVAFHELLLQAAGNRALAVNYRRVVNELDLYRRETISRSAQNIPVSTREHEAIVSAVAKRDEALAARLLHEHVLASRERLHAALADPTAPPAKPARAA